MDPQPKLRLSLPVFTNTLWSLALSALLDIILVLTLLRRGELP